MSAVDQLSRPGPHETRLAQVFGPRFRHDGTCLFPETPLVCLAFSNRCGSNLLGGYLRSVPGLHGFHEQLNFNTVEKTAAQAGLSTFPDYVAHLCRAAATRSEIYGFKASWDQLMMLKRQRIDHMFGDMRMIHLTRDDVVGQAISLSIADQTKQWTSEQIAQSGQEPRYFPNQLEALMDSALVADQHVRLIATYFEIPRLHVTYEELVADPAQTVTRIASFLSIPLQGWTPETPRISKQAGDVNSRFRTRLLDDTRAMLLS